MSKARTILFLQGPPTRFWRELAARFEAEGHRSLRINLCAGDFFYGFGRCATNYRGSLQGWGAFLTSFVKARGVTDILYYADRLPYHRVAIEVADKLGVNAITIENGYLRPDWLTLERGAMGALSHFPQEPDTIRAIAKSVAAPDLPVRYTYSFFDEAFNEVAYNLSNIFFFYLYPFYKADKYYNPIIEYLSWLPRLFRQNKAAEQADALQKTIVDGGLSYYLVALQIQSDYQIRANSNYQHLDEMIEEIVASFARRAPADAQLVFKLHPLDNGLENWPKVIARIAAVHGSTGRVHTIDGGHLGELLGKAKGCIVVNSTVGLHSIRAGCPTKILGIAVFDIAGLTHQGPLDDFWTTPEPVDAALAEDFVKAIAATIQVKGSFYNREGRRRAQREIVQRIADGWINEPGAYVDPPPRLARARKLGVPI